MPLAQRRNDTAGGRSPEWGVSGAEELLELGGEFPGSLLSDALTMSVESSVTTVAERRSGDQRQYAEPALRTLIDDLARARTRLDELIRRSGRYTASPAVECAPLADRPGLTPAG